MNASRARVLIVDDEPKVREVLRDILMDRYEVDFADTAVGALAAVRKKRPDAVLLDLNMPGAVGGDQIVAALATDFPVVVVTAVIDLDTAKRTLNAGAFDFIAKPFTIDRVLEVVEAAIAFGRRS